MSILLTALALLQTHKPELAKATPLAFVGVHVLPMTDERVLRDQTVLVADGRIARLGPTQEVELPADVTRIEGHGRFLVPGLMDSHVHCLDEGDLFVYLANGVTTVRNLKGMPWHLELRERIASGEILGPRFLTAGPFVNEPQVRTVDDVQRVVAEQVEAGYDCIKIHGDLQLATYEALLAEAALAEIPVIGHVPRNLAVERVLERAAGGKGQVEISHAEEYLYTYFDRLPGGVSAAAIESIAKATAAAGIAVTPNLVAYRSIVRQIEDLGRELARPEMAWVAPPGGRSWKPDLNRYARDFEPGDAAPMAKRYELLERFTKALQAAGVRLLTGSDAMNPAAVPGFSLQEELELLVAAGLTPYQALRAATASAGEFLGDGSGRVAVGAPADLVLLAANPHESIARMRAIEGVMVRGRWLSQADLAQGLQARARDYAGEEGFMSRITRENLDASLAYLHDARAKDPHAFVFRPEGLESLAIVYGMIGNHASARVAAELAVQEFPARWTAFARLGEACLATQDEAAASAAFARALELHPADPRLARALEALAEKTR